MVERKEHEQLHQGQTLRVSELHVVSQRVLRLSVMKQKALRWKHSALTDV